MVSKSKSTRSLSGGAIAGIVIGVVVFLIVLVAAAFFLVRRRRTTQSQLDYPSPKISSPIQDYEKISPVAPRLPGPAVTHHSDRDVERSYLESPASDANNQAPVDTPRQAAGRPMPGGKLAKLTGDTQPRSLSDMAPKARIQSLKPAGERRTVPYRPDDFA
jgi:cell division protein FtsN